MSNQQSDREKYAPVIQAAAKTYGVPEEILTRLLNWESGNWSPDVVYGRKKGSSGEIGVAQFMPATAAKYGLTPESLANPVASIGGAARHLQDLGKKYQGDWEKAVAAYNAGEPQVDKAVVDSTTNRLERNNITGALDKLTGGRRNPSNADWKQYIPASTRNIYLPNVYGQGEGTVGTQEFTNAFSTLNPANKKPSGGQPSADDLKPNWQDYVDSPTFAGDPALARSAFAKDTATWRDLISKNVSDAAAYFDLVSAEMAQEISRGNLSLNQANSEFANRLKGFDSGIQAYSILAAFATPKDASGNIYGTDAFSDVGLGPVKSSGVHFNPFQYAADLVKQSPTPNVGNIDNSRFREASNMVQQAVLRNQSLTGGDQYQNSDPFSAYGSIGR